VKTVGCITSKNPTVLNVFFYPLTSKISNTRHTWHTRRLKLGTYLRSYTKHILTDITFCKVALKQTVTDTRRSTFYCSLLKIILYYINDLSQVLDKHSAPEVTNLSDQQEINAEHR